MAFDAADIYAIVTPEVNDALVQQRIAALVSLDAPNIAEPHFPAWIELTYLGLSTTNTTSSSAGVSAILNAIKKEQPSFPTDPQQRSLELRITAAAALSRHLTTSSASDDRLAQKMAALILTAARLRRPEVEVDARYAALTHELQTLSQDLLDRSARSRRKRITMDSPSIEGSDVAAVALSASAALNAMWETISANTQADREELQVLWWVFGRSSTSLQKPFAELTHGDATASAASELASLMLLPPLPAAVDFLRAVLGTTSALPLDQLVAQLSAPALQSYAVKSAAAQKMVREHPGLLPFTWLAGRLIESNRSPWAAEYETRTQLSAKMELPVGEWAQHLFTERVATLILEGSEGGQ